MGKTSLATNIAFAAAQRFVARDEDGIDPAKSAGAPVAFFSLEMSADQLATRILAEESGISSENLRMGKISQQEFRQLARAAAELQSLPLYIDDTPGLTIAALRTRARRLKRQKGIGWSSSTISSCCRAPARQRKRQSRPGNLGDQPRPEAARQGARAAGAGAVAAQPCGRAARGQAAAAVRSARIGLDRAGRRHGLVRLSRAIIISPPRSRTTTIRISRHGTRRWTAIYGLADLIVAKQRHGATGKVRMKFDSRITKFSDAVDDAYLPEMRS